MPVPTQNNDQAFSTALPVQKPGQQFGSVSRLPSYQRFTQLEVIQAARQEIQRSGSYDARGAVNPLYTPNGDTNSYQEARYQPAGRPMPGPTGISSTARSTIQGYQFSPLTSASVFGGSISDNIPPPPADTYTR